MLQVPCQHCWGSEHASRALGSAVLHDEDAEQQVMEEVAVSLLPWEAAFHGRSRKGSWRPRDR